MSTWLSGLSPVDLNFKAYVGALRNKIFKLNNNGFILIYK